LGSPLVAFVDFLMWINRQMPRSSMATKAAEAVVPASTARFVLLTFVPIPVLHKLQMQL